MIGRWISVCLLKREKELRKFCCVLQLDMAQHVGKEHHTVRVFHCRTDTSATTSAASTAADCLKRARATEKHGVTPGTLSYHASIVWNALRDQVGTKLGPTQMTCLRKPSHTAMTGCVCNEEQDGSGQFEKMARRGCHWSASREATTRPTATHEQRVQVSSSTVGSTVNCFWRSNY